MNTPGTTRRALLRAALVGAGGWLYGLPLARGASSALDAPRRALLDSVIDTLVPEDAWPGALGLGVPARIAALLAGDPRRARLYRRGLEALARRTRRGYKRPFAELPPMRREQLLHEQAAGMGPAGIFLHYARRDVLREFYSDPGAWAMLDYRPPRQGYAYTPAGADDAGG